MSQSSVEPITKQMGQSPITHKQMSQSKMLILFAASTTHTRCAVALRKIALRSFAPPPRTVVAKKSTFCLHAHRIGLSSPLIRDQVASGSDSCSSALPATIPAVRDTTKSSFGPVSIPQIFGSVTTRKTFFSVSRPHLSG